MDIPTMQTKLMNVTVTLEPDEHFEDSMEMYEKYMPSLIANCRLISDRFKVWAELTELEVIHFHACISCTKPKQTPCAIRRFHALAGNCKVQKVKNTGIDYRRSWEYDNQESEKKHGIFKHPYLPSVLTEYYYRKDVLKATLRRITPEPEINIVDQLNATK